MSGRTFASLSIQAVFLAAIYSCSREAAAPTETAAPSAGVVPTEAAAPSQAQHSGGTGPPGFIFPPNPSPLASGEDLFPAITNRVATTSALLNAFFNNVTPGSSRLLLSNSEVEATRRSTTDVIILARDYSNSPTDDPSAPQLTAGALSNIEAFLRQGGCIATEFSSNTLWFQNHNWVVGIPAPTLPTLAFPPTVGVEGGFLTGSDLGDPDSHTVVRSTSALVRGIPSTFADAVGGLAAGDLDGNLFGDLAGAGIKVITRDSDEDSGAPPVAIETLASAKVDAGTAVMMLSDWQDINSVNPADIDPEIGRLWVNVANCPAAPAPELIFTVVFEVISTGGDGDIELYDNLKLSTVPLPGLNRSKRSDRSATISGDERFIAFVSGRTGAGDVFLYDRATESIVPVPGLNDAAVLDRSPSLSDDGDLIAFDSNRSGSSDVFLYDRTAGLLLLAGLNDAGAKDEAPALSASGRYIAFESDRNANGDVLLYDRNTQSLVSLPGLNTGALERSPNLAKDGRLVAFESDRSGNGDIFLYDRDTQGLISLPGLNSSTAQDAVPSITPGGRFIAFQTDRTGAPSILVYDRKSSSLLSVPGLETPRLEQRPEIR